MPKNLIVRSQYKIKELQCGNTTLHSAIYKQKLPLGKAFFESMFLPKYGLLNADRKAMIPHGSLLAEKIEKRFIDEIANNRSSYPQDRDEEKYMTELKFQMY